MCGIGGIVGGPSSLAVLERMADEMEHRGPDSRGVWQDGEIGVVIRRLAIIDLDPRSNQPLHLGPWHLVFNGEIYNYLELRRELEGLGHSFRTEGDGEVLLHAWAEWEAGALERLNGMFALALWNDERSELVCACDPFGEKPLYWTSFGAQVAFASDIRALLLARPQLGAPNEPVIAPYLTLGAMPPIDESFFQGIARLPGGHLLRFRSGRATVERYWAPRRVEVPQDYPEAVARVRELLEDSIRLRLRSDVPVGSCLSGGIDSSAVVCIAGRLAGEHQRHAFTARFPGFERDEWRYAEAVGRAAGVVEHHAVEPAAEELLADLDAVVRSQEEPFGSSSIYAQWRVMKAARAAGITVLLDGQGADELFGGYPGVNGWALRSMGATAVMKGLASSRDRPAVLLALGSGKLPAAAGRLHRRRLASPYMRPELAVAGAEAMPPVVALDGFTTPLARELLRQSFHTSMPALLRYADRSSMAHSREVRLPYLDRRLAEFALSLPASFLYRDGLTKAVLRDAVRDIVPSEVLDRRDKVGFETPQARWLSEPGFVAAIRETLLDPAARRRGYYEPGRIEADAAAGHWRDPAGIWRALNLELWLRMFDAHPRVRGARLLA